MTRVKEWFSEHAVDACIGLVLVLVVAMVIAAFMFGESDGRHSWRGGSGPDTRCFYEIRDETQTSSDGKGGTVQTPVQVTYTVCQDAR